MPDREDIPLPDWYFFERHLRNVGIKSDAQNGVTRGITRTYILSHFTSN